MTGLNTTSAPTDVRPLQVGRGDHVFRVHGLPDRAAASREVAETLAIYGSYQLDKYGLPSTSSALSRVGVIDQLISGSHASTILTILLQVSKIRGLSFGNRLPMSVALLAATEPGSYASIVANKAAPEMDRVAKEQGKYGPSKFESDPLAVSPPVRVVTDPASVFLGLVSEAFDRENRLDRAIALTAKSAIGAWFAGETVSGLFADQVIRDRVTSFLLDIGRHYEPSPAGKSMSQLFASAIEPFSPGGVRALRLVEQIQAIESKTVVTTPMKTPERTVSPSLMFSL